MTGVNPDFKIDLLTGPGPLTTYESDEDSFVVLGKSLINDIDYNSTETDAQIGNKTIQEAKKIIDEEIRKLSLNSKGKSVTQDENVCRKTESTTSVGINPFRDLSDALHEASVSDENSAEKTSFLKQMGNSLKNWSSIDDKSFDKQSSISQKKIEVVSSASSLRSSMVEEIPPKVQEGENQILLSGIASLQEEKIRAEVQKASVSREQNCFISRDADQMQNVATMSAEDLQKKIMEIIEENVQLRKILEHNSIKMREQCNRIVEWQNEVKKVHNVHKEKLLEAKEHIEKLNREKIDANNQIAVLQDELNMTRTKLAEIQIVQTEVQQTRSVAYSKISALNAEIQRLQQTIEELQQRENRADEIFALETQLEIFKADFEAERRAKESIKEEKEKLCEDLQNLQRRNQQLQERIEMISDKDYVMYESRSSTDRPNRGNSSSEALLECPKCRGAFGNMTALENHCYTCIT